VPHALRTFLRTNRVTGGLVTWGWRHYLTAIAESLPADCDGIPKVPGAGRTVADPDGTAYHVMHNGLKVVRNGYYDATFTEVIRVLRGHHEPQEERVFHEVLPALPDAPCMIEAGGYWAYYSMWAKLARPRARSVLIEPVDSHRAVGEANLALNGMTAEFLRASVGAESRPPADVTLEGVRVPALEQVSIDDVVGRLGIPFVHVLHADVQGAELDLLRGAAGTIRGNRVGYVFLSTHGDRLHARCRDFLTDHGLSVVAEHTRRESFTTDGLIVAKAVGFPGPDRVAISRNTRRASPTVVLAYALRRLGLGGRRAG